MVGTIASVVNRRRAYVLSLTYLLGASLSAASVGAIVGGLSSSIGLAHMLGTDGIYGSVALAAAIALAIDLGVVRVAPMYCRRQVPSIWWNDRGPAPTAFVWGFQLGVAPLTYLPSASYYVVLWVAALLGPVLGACAMVAFGLARGLHTSLVLLWSNGDRPVADVAVPDVTNLVRASTLAVAVLALLASLS